MRTERKSSFSIRFIFVYIYIWSWFALANQQQRNSYVCRLGTLNILIRRKFAIDWRKNSSLWFGTSTNANKDQSEEECFRKKVGKNLIGKFLMLRKFISIISRVYATNLAICIRYLFVDTSNATHPHGARKFIPATCMNIMFIFYFHFFLLDETRWIALWPSSAFRHE